MTTMLALLASGVLIGAGIGVIWSDIRRSRRRSFIGGHVPTRHRKDDVQVSIARRRADDLPAVELLPLERTRKPPPLPQPAAQAKPTPELPDPGLQEAVDEWEALQPTVAAGVLQINELTDDVKLVLGAPGEATWSYGNKAYGAYRRLLCGEESLGWVRIELAIDGMLCVSVKAHRRELDMLSRTASAPSQGLTSTIVVELLSDCLIPAAEHAASLLPRTVEDAARATGWEGVADMVESAVLSADRTLAQSGARLRPAGPASWDEDMQRHRLTLFVDCGATEIARLQIEKLDYEMEVAIGFRDPVLADLGRRRRIPIGGLTANALAEIVTSFVRPALARLGDGQQQQQ